MALNSDTVISKEKNILIIAAYLLRRNLKKCLTFLKLLQRTIANYDFLIISNENKTIRTFPNKPIVELFNLIKLKLEDFPNFIHNANCFAKLVYTRRKIELKTIIND